MNATRTGCLLAAGLALSGCAAINEGRDILAGLTNPLAVQVIVLGTDAPDDTMGAELPEEFSSGATATAFLADAGNVADLDRAPIVGATVQIESETLNADAPGVYTLTPGSLAYTAGQSWSFSATLDGRSSATATIDLARSAAFDLPENFVHDSNLSIDLTGQNFDGAFAFVTDSQGNTTFDNRPTDIRGFYELTRGNPVTTVPIPAGAFPEPGIYLIGIAGIRSTSGRENMTRMNTALSNMLSGTMVFEPLMAQ